MKYLSLDRSEDRRPGYQQLIKEKNIKRVFDLVRGGRCASRAELVRAMHLSATTISALVEELVGEGLLLETGPTLTSLPGRRPMSLAPECRGPAVGGVFPEPSRRAFYTDGFELPDVGKFFCGAPRGRERADGLRRGVRAPV